MDFAAAREGVLAVMRAVSRSIVAFGAAVGLTGVILALGLLLMALAGCSRSEAKVLPLRAVLASAGPEAGDSTTVTLFFRLGGDVGAVDSVGATLEVPPGTVVARRIATRAGTSVAFRILRPIGRIAGRVCIGPLYVKDSQIAGGCLPWEYDPPRVNPDSVVISRTVLRPKILAAVTGATQQVCAFAVLSDGRRVKMKNSWNNPYCETEYQKWLGEKDS